MATMSGALVPNSSVVDTTAQITSQDSPLMQQAAANANRQAARSGLMNSSLAVGASQGAVTSQAADLAKAEVAANQNQQGINNQASQYDRSQTEAERAAKIGENQSQQQITNQNTQFGQNLNLSQQQLNEQSRAAVAQEGLSQQQINNQSNQFTQSLNQQKYESDLANQQWNINQQLERDKFNEQSTQFAQSIQANVRGSYTDAANNLLNNSSVNINNIASNASITKADKDKLIAQELANRNNDLAYLQSMYSGVTNWANGL